MAGAWASSAAADTGCARRLGTSASALAALVDCSHRRRDRTRRDRTLGLRDFVGPGFGPLRHLVRRLRGPFRGLLVGFAAETENVIEHARGKLSKKKLDMIVANRVGTDCGFDCDDNAATVLWQGGERSFPTTSKVELARDLIELAANHFYAVRGAETQPKLTVISSKDRRT